MTRGAKRHQIALNVMATEAAKSDVVDLQLGAAAAILAAPAIALQYVLAQGKVGIRIKPHMLCV